MKLTLKILMLLNRYPAGLYAVIILAALMLLIFDRGSFDDLMPSRKFFDHYHTLIAAAVIALPFVVMQFIPERMAGARALLNAKKVINVSMAVIFISGLFMLIKVDLSILRLSYTLFDLGLAAVLSTVNTAFIVMYFKTDI